MPEVEAAVPDAGTQEAAGGVQESLSALASNKEAIFAEMERVMAGGAPTEPAPAEEPPSGTEASAVAAQAPPAVPPPAPGPEAPPAPDAAAEAGAPAELEKIRQALGKANLDVNVKKAVLDSYYRDQAYAKAGFKVEHARALNDIGFTPERAMRLAHLFPSEEIEQATVMQAQGFHRIMDDLRGDPANFLVELSRTDRDATAAIIDTVIDNFEKINPQKYNEQFNGFAKRLFDVIESEAASGEDEDLKEAVAIVANKVFPNRGKVAAGAQRGPVDPRVEAIERENQQFRERERQAMEAQQRAQVEMRSKFVSDAQSTALQLVTGEIRQLIDSKAASIPVDARGEVAELILRDVYNAATGNATVMRQINSFLNGAPLNQQGFNQAVQFAVKVAKGYIPPAAAQRITRWTNGASAGAAPGRPVAVPAPAGVSARTVPVPGNVTTTAQPKPASAIAFPGGKTPAPRDKDGWIAAFDALGPPQVARR